MCRACCFSRWSRPGKFGADLQGLDKAFLDPGPEAEALLKIDHVVPWETFASFVDSRRKSNQKLVFYIDSAGQTGSMSGELSNPPGFAAIENPHILWRDAIRQHWSDPEIKDAFPILDEVRWGKSSAELALLRKAASITNEGFWAGARAIAPGKTQRQVEGEVIRACLDAGSDGASFWPWVRSGPFTCIARWRSGILCRRYDFDYARWPRNPESRIAVLAGRSRTGDGKTAQVRTA